MNVSYERDLDLNLLRVFVVVAEAGSVTAAAGRLYLTQPAVSAAMRRLADSVGARLFARQGRGLALTDRGRKLFAAARPHLAALVEAARAPAAFDPATSERVVRLGLSDAGESWLLGRLLRALGARAPRMRLVVLPVQFRTVADALASGAVDLAVTVADELPADVRRRALFRGGFVCLFDPRHARLARPGRAPSLARYLAHEHAVVSYNGDLRGVVEDLLGMQRRVRVSLPSFHSVGETVEGTALVATVPALVARGIVALRPRLRTAPLPLGLKLGGTPMELLWRAALDDDAAVGFVRDLVAEAARDAAGESTTPRGPRRREVDPKR